MATVFRCSTPLCPRPGRLVEVDGRRERRCPVHEHEPPLDDYDGLTEQCNQESDEHERRYGL